MIYAWSNKMLSTQYHCGKFSYTTNYFKFILNCFASEEETQKHIIKRFMKMAKARQPKSHRRLFSNYMKYRHEHLKYILFCITSLKTKRLNIFPIPWYCRFYLSSWFMWRWSTYISCAREFQTVKPQTNL